MVMKKSSSRYSVAQAKARLSEVLRGAEGTPAVIHNRGRDVAVIVSMADYQRLRAQAGQRPTTQWRGRLDEWRARTGGVEFEPAPLTLEPAVVDFGARRR
jgi:prevent-host-death family protein